MTDLSAADPVGPSPTAETRPTPAAAHEVRFTALVVDDEPDVLLATRTVLQRAGFDVISAANGILGLKAIRESTPDIVLLDLMMPGLSGWDVLSEIRPLHIPTVIMTARACTSEDIVRGLNGGADDYIEKPFVGSELAARLRAVLRRYRRGLYGEEAGPGWRIAVLSSDGAPADDLRSRPALMNALVEDLRTPAALFESLNRQPWDLLVLDVAPHISVADLLGRIRLRAAARAPMLLMTDEPLVSTGDADDHIAVIGRPSPHTDLWGLVDQMLREAGAPRHAQAANDRSEHHGGAR